MKIVKINGGLGNQMFQYAFARRLETEYPGEVFIDSSALDGDTVHNGYELGRVFGASLPEARAVDVRRLSVQPRGLVNRVRRKYFTKRSHVIDKEFSFQPELLARRGDLYFDGYWQSERYFAPISQAIRRDFSFRAPLAERNLRLLEELRRPIASVHVRRGDYLKYANLNLCTPQYYSRAIAALEPGLGSLLVFSEDIDYCRSTLGFDGSRTAYVDWNRGEESWQDMAMMARCDHHVIANSSFSWWGAWLDPGEGKRVIAPALWNRREIEDEDRYYEFSFRDVLPPSWERAAL